LPAFLNLVEANPGECPRFISLSPRLIGRRLWVRPATAQQDRLPRIDAGRLGR
jgi:hypothetical protein